MTKCDLKEKTARALEGLIEAIKNVDDDIIREIEQFITKPKCITYVWNPKTMQRKAGYKQNRRKTVPGRKPPRYGRITDPVAVGKVLDMGVDYIKSHGITSRGQLRQSNNSLYMAMYHRNLLDCIQENL